MTLTERSEWGHGGVTYPLTEDMTNSLLRDADPSLALALDYYAAAMDLHFGARLRAQALVEGIKINAAVATKLAIRPTPSVLADNFLFPLFALFRTGTTRSEHTVVWDKDVGEWGFVYVLPVMSGRQIAQLSPILRSVERSIAHSTRQGTDPSYKNGADIWRMAGVQSIKLKDVRYDDDYEVLAQHNGVYRAVTGSIEVVERSMTVVGSHPPFGGANLTVNQVAEDGTTMLEILTDATFPAPTLSLLTPSSGSKAGGTVVVCVGTGFRAPMHLVVDTTTVELVVTSPTTATAVMPPHAAYPTFMSDVTVVSGDGQTFRLPAGFTFTTP